MKESKIDKAYMNIINSANRKIKKQHIIKEDVDSMVDGKWHYMFGEDTLQISSTLHVANIESFNRLDTGLRDVQKELQERAKDLENTALGLIEPVEINGDTEGKGTFFQIIDKNNFRLGIIIKLLPECRKDYLDQWLKHWDMVPGF